MKLKHKAFYIITIIISILLPVIVEMLYQVGEKHALIRTGYSQGEVLSYLTAAIALLIAVVTLYITQNEIIESNKHNKEALEIALEKQRIENKYNNTKKWAEEIYTFVTLRDYKGLYSAFDNSIILMLRKDLNRHSLNIMACAMCGQDDEKKLFMKIKDATDKYSEIIKQLVIDTEKLEIKKSGSDSRTYYEKCDELYRKAKSEINLITYTDIATVEFDLMYRAYLQELETKINSEIRELYKAKK